MSEEDFSFPTYAGNIKVEVTDEALTPFGGLVAFASFLKRTSILEDLVRELVKSVSEEEWQGAKSRGLLQVVDKEIKLSGWTKSRRVILARREHRAVTAESGKSLFDFAEFKYDAYVTDLSIEEVQTWQIVDLYNQRSDCENIFDELKNQWGLDGFCSKNANVTELAARFTLLTYNLWNLFSRLMEPDRHVEAGTGRRWYTLIASRLEKTAREKIIKLSV